MAGRLAANPLMAAPPAAIIHRSRIILDVGLSIGDSLVIERLVIGDSD
jgi:hypothetical protein